MRNSILNYTGNRLKPVVYSVPGTKRSFSKSHCQVQLSHQTENRGSAALPWQFYLPLARNTAWRHRNGEWERAGCCPRAAEVEVTEQQPGRAALWCCWSCRDTSSAPPVAKQGETLKFAPTMVIQLASICHLC